MITLSAVPKPIFRSRITSKIKCSLVMYFLPSFSYQDQYVFLNQCVMDIIKSQRERKTDLIYQNVTAMAIYENFTPGPAFGKANGYHA